MAPTRLLISRIAVLAAFVLAGCSKSQPITAPNPVGAGLQNSSVSSARGEISRPAGLQGHQFVPRSDNPYFPLVPGTTFFYRSRTPDGIETEKFTVTRRTKKIQGVNVIVVEDVVRLNGVVTERTTDWFAMDEHGNVWYFGENSLKIDPDTGETSTAGSWMAGVDGAEAGIIMEAHPRVGDTYDEENAPGAAQDRAQVLALDAEAKVPRGRFDDCLQTENTTLLDPAALENKFYAPGVGLVLEIDVAGGGTRNQLVRVTRSDRGHDDGDEDRASGGGRD